MGKLASLLNLGQPNSCLVCLLNRFIKLRPGLSLMKSNFPFKVHEILHRLKRKLPAQGACTLCFHKGDKRGEWRQGQREKHKPVFFNACLLMYHFSCCNYLKYHQYLIPEAMTLLLGLQSSEQLLHSVLTSAHENRAQSLGKARSG